MTPQFQSAIATSVVLAKVGNAQREEPLQTSKEVFRISEEDQDLLTALFLRPFRNLVAHRFMHHSSLKQHEMYSYVQSIFLSEQSLLERGCDIARHLYAKSTHPNIKSGDLCVGLVEDIEIGGRHVRGLVILKAESTQPFLSITARDGDLTLSTEHGINPERIDKGCLIVDFAEDEGYYVLTFDRAGSESKFWVRDFLGVQPVADSAFLTTRYTEMAASFVEQDLPSNEEDDVAPWEAASAVAEAINYFDEREQFDLEEFQSQVLKTPEAIAKFGERLNQFEEEQGAPLQTTFEIAPKEVKKAKKRISSMIKLDTGVDIMVRTNGLTTDLEAFLERGFDEEKEMKFIKVFYNKVVS